MSLDPYFFSVGRDQGLIGIVEEGCDQLQRGLGSHTILMRNSMHNTRVFNQNAFAIRRNYFNRGCMVFVWSRGCSVEVSDVKTSTITCGSCQALPGCDKRGVGRFNPTHDGEDNEEVRRERSSRLIVLRAPGENEGMGDKQRIEFRP